MLMQVHRGTTQVGSPIFRSAACQPGVGYVLTLCPDLVKRDIGVYWCLFSDTADQGHTDTAHPTQTVLFAALAVAVLCLAVPMPGSLQPAPSEMVSAHIHALASVQIQTQPEHAQYAICTDKVRNR